MRQSRIDAITNGIKQNMPDRVWLTYIDYRDDLNNSGKIFQECLKRRDCSALYEEVDFSEQEYTSADSELDDIAKRLNISQDAWDEYKGSEDWDELRYELYDRDQSEPYQEILKQTEIDGRLMIRSNYEACAPHYAIEYDMMSDTYLQTTMAALSLNPAKVKRAMLENYDIERREIPGRWPNIKSREGHEVVAYKDFVACWFETPSYGQFSFFGRLPLEKLYSANFDVTATDWTIPAKTTCGFYNTWDGGGTLELIETIRPVSLQEINKRLSKTSDSGADIHLEVDERGCGGYCSSEVYGGELSSDDLLSA